MTQLIDRLPEPQAPETESMEALSFSDQLQKCADDIRAGRITDASGLSLVWQLGGQMRHGQYEGSFTDADGMPLYQPDAELVWSMRTLDAWKFDKDERKELRGIRELFYGKQDELDPGVTLEDLEKIHEGRVRLQHLLSIDNPYGVSLHELSEIAGKRLLLSEEIELGQVAALEGVADAPPLQESQPAAVQPAERAEQQTEEAEEPKPRLHLAAVPSPEDESAAALEPGWLPPPRRRRSVGEQDPAKPYTGAKSHRHPNAEKAARRRRAVAKVASAAAAIALVGLGSAFVFNGVKKEAPDRPAAVAELYSDWSSQDSQKSEPIQIAPIASSRTVSLGEYDVQKHTGALWFQAEDDAAKLGAKDLSVIQAHKLTDRYIKYMDKHMPGGMSWSKAKQISPDTELQLPPLDTVGQWIVEITGQSGQSA